ncbi:prostate stem cell antigen-like [Patiria miniata]|uniref:UPAR/Ly6 domain-containing protein n=1 Tax=Patiria miniata TaxID=46514 RepID=A0A914BB31_PATMI|nr:prostate stem cell antigen-like [Patiria miniata]
MSCTWCSLFIAIAVIVLATCIQFVSSLQCYTCAAEDTNDNCNINEAPILKTCSAREDQCLTQVIYSTERGKLRIDKYCASQDGCDAATEQLGKRYFCDKSRAGWGCVECCETDKCNLSAGDQLRVSAAVIYAVAVVSRLIVRC